VIGRRDDLAGAAESEELERLCDRLKSVEAPFDEITRSRAETRLVGEIAREPARRHRRTLAWTAALVAVGSAAAGALVARAVAPANRSPIAGPAALSLKFEPYVVAAAGSAVVASAVPEALVEPTSRLDVPAGWLVRASLGDAITVTLTGPARAWAKREGESAADKGRTVVHLEQGRLLASLEGGAGRRFEIVSPGAVTDVVGTLFSVEVVGGASRVAVAHGRVQVTAAVSAGAPARTPREIAAGQSWLTARPETDGLEPALAEALAEHERMPPPRGATVPLSVTEAPAGAGVWVGQRRIASAPAWMLVEPRAAVRLSTKARAATAAQDPTDPHSPPSTEPARETSTEPSRPLSAPPARAMKPAGAGPLVASVRGDPTQPPPLDSPSAAPEEMTAQSLFREADAARAAGDTALALRTLRALIERFPRDSATAAARYELALMEDAAGSGDAALRDLAAVDAPSLEEPTEYLRCRVLAKRTAVNTTRAEQCLADFRRHFPASAHGADALATQTALAMARGGCAAAQALLAELERRHPTHDATARLRAACNRRP